jgi:murein DD-endopeptidase MepM/ murein hydrolase activator NlpD
VNFKTLQKGDRLAIVYERKKRLGKYIGEPNIKVAMIETRGKKNYIYKFNDVFYNASGKEVENFLLTRPVPNARISSRFNPKRFHPVLKRYRAHLGTDYAAPKGTKIYAAGDGVVSFVGTKGGYGKTVKKKAQWLLENGFYSVAGSDLHCEDAIEYITSCKLDEKSLMNVAQLLKNRI